MTNDTPLVSVIVLTYNQQGTIGRTLDSILAQHTSFAYEIVIGEDASTDGTRAICEEYSTKHPGIVRLMPKAPNKGVVRNYFDTLAECRGQLIADCAGDDFWCDNQKLQKQALLMQMHPEVSVVHSAWRENDSQSVTQSPFCNLREKGGVELLRAIALQTTAPVIHLCTALYRKHIVAEAVAQDPDFFLSPRWKCEDLQIAYVLAKGGEVLYMPEPTLRYTVGEATVSNPVDELKMFDFYLSATDLSHEIVKRENLSGTDVDAYFQNRIFALLMHLLRADAPQRLGELKEHISQWHRTMNKTNSMLAYCLDHSMLRHTLQSLRRLALKYKRLFNH